MMKLKKEKIMKKIMKNYPNIFFSKDSLKFNTKSFLIESSKDIFGEKKSIAFNYSVIGLNDYEQETIYYFDNNYKLVYSTLSTCIPIYRIKYPILTDAMKGDVL